MATTEADKYHIYLDYKGYQIEPDSYRVFPAPLFGTRFATGVRAYETLDFWQVNAMTDFTKGINQKFLSDPSRYYYSEGIDCSKLGECRLERNFETMENYPSGKGAVTASYRAIGGIHFVGTVTGKILRSTDGDTYAEVEDTGYKIYAFFEMQSSATTYIYATGGANNTYRSSDGESWTVCVGGTFTPDPLADLYFVMVESDYAYGLFGDGIKQTTDGETWAPPSPQKLWGLPYSEGNALNAIPIPRGFLIGAQRGLWIFLGGGAGIAVWLFPDFASASNFKGIGKFGIYGIFSIEKLGIFYTEGSTVYPTNLNFKQDAFKANYCNHIYVSGWDVFAIVSDDNVNWYLARCNMFWTRTPKHWWIVKELGQEATHLSSYSDDLLLIHYSGGTCHKYNRVDGPYQTSGYLETSWTDEALILLQKLYRSISAIFSSFLTDTTCSLDYRTEESTSFPNEIKNFAGDGSVLDQDYTLPNPLTGQRIQFRVSLGTTDTAKSPVLADLCWKYILQRPKEESNRKRNWHFLILAEDVLEKTDFDTEELGIEEPRSRQNILDDIWNTRDKKQILNYVGADNINKKAFTISYNGTNSTCILRIDRTNFKITTEAGTDDIDISYEGKTIDETVTLINAESAKGYSATTDTGELGTTTSSDNLFPIDEMEITGGAQIYYGTDIHAIIFNAQAPGIYKRGIEGRGSDRINISLREV